MSLNGVASDIERARKAARPEFYGHIGLPGSSWLPVHGPRYLIAGDVDPPPSILHRDDGPALLYPGKSHSISAEPESGKGWAAILACAEVLSTDGTALYIDHETSPSAIYSRLLNMGVAPDAILSRFHYVGPEERLDGPGRLEPLLFLEPDLVIIDGWTEALALQGLELNDNGDVAAYLNLVVRPFKARGSAVVLVDHVTKDRESRGRYGIGAQHKLAGVDVAYTLDVIEPFGRGREGLVKLTVAKDRPGYVRQHAEGGKRAGLMRLTSHDDGSVSVSIEPPEQQDGGWRPTVLMERVSRAIEGQPGMTRTEIRSVQGNNAAKDKALAFLIQDGYVRVKLEGRAQRHYSAKPYRDGDGGTCPPDLPNLPTAARAPAHASAQLSAHLPPALEAGAEGQEQDGGAAA